MIVDFSFTLAFIVIGVMTTFLSAINFIIPQQFTDSITYFISYLGYFSGIINFQGIFQALGTFVLFTTYWYTFRIVLWIINLMPFYHGKKIKPTA